MLLPLLPHNTKTRDACTLTRQPTAKNAAPSSTSTGIERLFWRHGLINNAPTTPARSAVAQVLTKQAKARQGDASLSAVEIRQCQTRN